MLRAIAFLLIAAVLLALAWGLGSIPGTLIAQSGPYTVTTSVPAAIIILLVLAALIALLLRLIGGVRRAPVGYGNWRSGRRQKQGNAATERAIVALAAGDTEAANAEAATARRLLGDTAMVLLLTAESARLAGQPERANAAFKQLTRHKGLAFIGHRGLLRHHLEGDDPDAAAAHALAAGDAYPGSQWLQGQRLEIALKKRDFPASLRLTRNPAEVAALATEAANAAAVPADALRYAKQAIKASPGFAPAIAAYAGALRRTRRERVARKALGKGWAASPHPMLASAWLDGIGSPIERAQAAAELAKNAPGHPESELLLAETALAAKLTGEARRHANAAIQAGATDKRAFSVLASLDPSVAAVTAANQAPAPTWHCSFCGGETTDWSAICPSCGKIASLRWQTREKGNTPLSTLPSEQKALPFLS